MTVDGERVQENITNDTKSATKGYGKGSGPSAPLLPGKGKGKGKTMQRDKAVCESIHSACQFDDCAELVELLQKNEVSDLKEFVRRNLSPLHTAAANGSMRVLRELLGRRCAVDVVNNFRETPLHLAATGGHSLAVVELACARASLELTDAWGRTPLRVAREVGATSVSEALIGAGAKEATGEVGLQEKSTSELDEKHRSQRQELKAEFMSRVELRPVGMQVEPIVKHIFKGPDCSTNSVKSPMGLLHGTQRQPLSKLVEYPGDPLAVAKLLTEFGVDPTGRDAFALTALHKFAAWDKIDLMELLLPHLSDGDVNATGGDEGFSALHYAVSMGALRTMRALLSHPAIDRTVQDRKGRTARELAASTRGLESCVTELQEM